MESMETCRLLPHRRRSEGVEAAKAGKLEDMFLIPTLFFGFGEDKEYLGL